MTYKVCVFIKTKISFILIYFCPMLWRSGKLLSRWRLGFDPSRYSWIFRAVAQRFLCRPHQDIYSQNKIKTEESTKEHLTVLRNLLKMSNHKLRINYITP